MAIASATVILVPPSGHGSAQWKPRANYGAGNGSDHLANAYVAMSAQTSFHVFSISTRSPSEEEFFGNKCWRRIHDNRINTYVPYCWSTGIWDDAAVMKLFWVTRPSGMLAAIRRFHRASLLKRLPSLSTKDVKLTTQKHPITTPGTQRPRQGTLLGL
ncbi:hypothetical protein P175DRAFT_0534778 [Aspergillus ochraceoroseus IBT 24754]|uniref:Uncharacterized protein n=1 Tax=Aspergillus ochraceoroseus IBT 24754 TaxID=1392256 RepID=A0A2T5LRS9_9EURO|nr:uncharacterized protein P175DRAFT_0534778 [Aspergillus ochraceoroseus IBT 24754]PTU18992.1 hypothetical protein P175DRAFT_0534778 [Aspergillus ochraceoroseus IBT 24754]